VSLRQHVEYGLMVVGGEGSRLKVSPRNDSVDSLAVDQTQKSWTAQSVQHATTGPCSVSPCSVTVEGTAASFKWTPEIIFPKNSQSFPEKCAKINHPEL
jgi:hypothetical protein